MGKVHEFLAMWQGRQNLRATQKQSHTQYRQMTNVGYVSDPEEIVKASWSVFQHHGAAAFKLSERSHLAPPVFAKDLTGGQTQIMKVPRIQRINRNLVESDENSGAASISNNEDRLTSGGDLDNPNVSEDHCAADGESDIEQTTASRIRNAQNIRLCAPRQMFLEWFGLNRCQRDNLKGCWWRSMPSKQGGIKEWGTSRTDCVNVAPASCLYLDGDF